MPWISVVMRASIALKSVAQLIDGIFGAVDRHAIVGLAGLQDAPHRIAQIAQRLQRRSRQEHAADHADDERGAGAEHQHAPEVGQQLVARFARLADLQQRCRRRSIVATSSTALRSRARTCAPDRVGAAGQLRQVECAPCFRQRVEQHVFEGADQPHEQRLARSRSLLDLDRARQRRQPARLVARRVFAQRRLDDVVIALLEQMIRAVRRSGRRSRRCWRGRSRDTTPPAAGRAPG